MRGIPLGDKSSEHVGKDVWSSGLDGALRDDLAGLSNSRGRQTCEIGAYDNTFTLCFFMQLGSHFMHPHMFASSIDVSCEVVDAGLDDLSTVPTEGLLIVSGISIS
jgi:hypothetical protein